MNRIWGLLVAGAACQAGLVLADGGRFEGPLAVEAVDDIRYLNRLRLLEDFSFIDAAGTRWTLARGAVGDDRVVPRALRPLAGLPAEEAYPRAAVVYNVLAWRRDQPWRRAVRLLHGAARAEGVDETQARLLYVAAYAGGWRWEVAGSRCYGTCHLGALAWQPDPTAADLAPVADWVRTSQPGLDAIDARLDALLSRRGPHTLGLPHWELGPEYSPHLQRRGTP